jgi:predicted nuclease of predicted toxin-antitoxin system
MTTKFLVDECVNQKPIRAIPAESKGFEIVFPRDRSFTGAGDISVAKLAQTEDRVLVTSDSDFSRLNFKPGDIPQGVVWLHPPKSSKHAIQNLLEKFCRYRQENFSEGPYDFRGQMIEVRRLPNGARRTATNLWKNSSRPSTLSSGATTNTTDYRRTPGAFGNSIGGSATSGESGSIAELAGRG